MWWLLVSLLTVHLAWAAPGLDLSVLSSNAQRELKQQVPEVETGSLTPDVLNRVIKFAIGNQEYDFAEIIREKDGRLKLSVGKTQRINEVKFSGSKTIPEAQLRREFNIKEKSRFDQEELIDGAERLRKLYEEYGFPLAVIDLTFFRISESEVGVEVIVKEGVRTILTDFKVLSSNPQLNKDLTKELDDYAKDPYTNATMAELYQTAREFLAKNKYFRSELGIPAIEKSQDESKATLTFNIRYSDQYRVEYSGNKKENNSDLNKALDLENFYSANPQIAPELASRLRQHYLKKGFARAEVDSREEPGSKPNEKVIRIHINEGPIVKIKNIEFNGILSEDSSEYVSILKKYSAETISDGIYNKDDFDQALKNLVVDRQNHGFLRAKLNSIRTSYNDKRDQISIYVSFDEGPLTQLEEVRFEGNNSFPAEKLLDVVGLSAGEPLQLNVLEQSVSKLKEFYQNSGYLEMKIENEREDLVTYSENNNLAKVAYRINEGPLVKVTSIIIEGNSITQDYVIRKELEFKEGDTLTPRLIQESTARLQRLGHFNTVEIQTLEAGTQIAERTAVIRVSDRDPGLINLGVGVNNERKLTVRGYAGVAYRNISGTGRSVSARLEGNYNVTEIKYLERKITLGYLEPYLLDTRVRGRGTLTRATSVSDFNERKGSEVVQFVGSLEQDITSHLLVVWDVWSLATVRDFPIDPDNTSIPRTEINIGSTALTMDLDYRNHPFNPTAGTFTRLNAEYGSPVLGSTRTIEYIRNYGSFTHYLELGKTNWVWANSLRGGFLKNLSKESDGGVPYDKKGMLLGGQGTLRGFTPSEAFPNAKDLGENYILTTEAKMFLVKSEIRFPIYGDIGGAVFYDGGSIEIKGLKYNKDPYRDAVGLGFRYATPVGAVSLEVGYKLDLQKDRGESQFPIHFSIGTF